MLENVFRFVAKFGDKEAHLIFPNGMPVTDLETMCLQVLQYLGKYKEAQAAAQASVQAEQPPVESPKIEELDQQKVE